jgi:hypothetical protein
VKVLGASSKRSLFKEKVVTSMRPKSWGADPVNVCLHITRITKRHCVNHKENFFFAHERTFLEGQIIRLTGFLAFQRYR